MPAIAHYEVRGTAWAGRRQRPVDGRPVIWPRGIVSLMTEASYDFPIVGLGNAAATHLTVLEQIPGAEVVAGAGIEPKTGRHDGDNTTGDGARYLAHAGHDRAINRRHGPSERFGEPLAQPPIRPLSP